MAYNLAMAALPVGSLLGLRRGVEPESPWALGAAIGAVGGAWAAVLVDLWCPLTNLPHLFMGHVLPLGVLIVAGALLSRSKLGVRAFPTGATNPPPKPRAPASPRVRRRGAARSALPAISGNGDQARG